MRASGEVDFLHGRMSDQGRRHGCGIRSLVVNNVDSSCGETSFPENVTNGPETLGREF